MLPFRGIVQFPAPMSAAPGDLMPSLAFMGTAHVSYTHKNKINLKGKINKPGWGSCSVGKVLAVRTQVQIPNTHIKSQRYSMSP